MSDPKNEQELEQWAEKCTAIGDTVKIADELMLPVIIFFWVAFQFKGCVVNQVPTAAFFTM